MQVVKDQKNVLQIITLVGVVISIATSVWAGCQIVRMEAMKVGGMDNRNKFQSIMKSEQYKEQSSQQIDLMMEQINSPVDYDSFYNEDATYNQEDIEALTIGTTDTNETEEDTTVIEDTTEENIQLDIE